MESKPAPQVLGLGCLAFAYPSVLVGLYGTGGTYIRIAGLMDNSIVLKGTDYIGIQQAVKD